MDTLSLCIGRFMSRKFPLFLFTCVLLSVVSCGGGSTGGGTPPPPQAFLTLTLSPAAVDIYPNSSFVIGISATTNSSALPTVTLGQLPAGITTTTTFPLSVTSSGATITFQAGQNLGTGTLTIPITGQAGTATASVNLSATPQTNAPPNFFFVQNLFSELAIPFGGSGSVKFQTIANGQAAYPIQLSLTGLPAGTTATITPPVVTVGQAATVVVSASSTAPETQNAVVTLTGTPGAAIPNASVNFLVDVTPKTGSLPNNRTDYVSTEATPYSAVYDPFHKLIFASNDSWNRVEVISAETHAIVTRIPIPEPRGIDISPDGAKVWVATGSRQMFAIDTSSLSTTRYSVPQGPVSYWEGSAIYTLSDGTILFVTTAGKFTGISNLLLWDPLTNSITVPNPPANIGTSGITKSGDGNRVYFIASDSGGNAFYYDVPTKSFSAVTKLAGNAIASAVNSDGSRLVVCDSNGPYMYDGAFRPIGPLPACGFGSAPFFEGGSVFTRDNRYLYQSTLASVPVIIKIDANTLNVLSLAPAMPMIPVMTELSPPYYVANPFAVDDTGMVLGIQDGGIAFDDGAFTQNYSDLTPGSPTFLQHMSPYFGPLSGGTRSAGFGNAFSITPDVWYGSNKGSASLDSSGSLTISSPPSNVPGPVNLKMLFPDGIEVFDPLFFSYGPYLQYPLISGAGPQGNSPGQIAGYGLPGDGTTGTLTIGNSSASPTPPGTFGLQFAGTPYPNKILGFTVPSGSQGWNDITLTTTEGTSKLPKSFYYAKSVTDYPSTDTFDAVLYDSKRQQLYLSAGDHIDVFSLASGHFASPLTPPAVGAVKRFAGMAMTPDGGLLLAADNQDGSLAVINPDNPASSYAIFIAPVGNNGNQNCVVGPLFVAGIQGNAALVTYGGLIGAGCGPGGQGYLINLQTHAVTSSSVFTYLSATRDGSKVATGGGCIYDVATKTSSCNSAYQVQGATISGDGNVAADDFVLTDASANVIGRVARPDVFYASLGGSNALQPEFFSPPLNDSGSLYFMAYPNFFDIVDVIHGLLRIRFGLSETISNVTVPMAIDSGGRNIFLITNQGLTVVDLGEAVLSIGWVTPTSVSPGTTITVRGSGFGSTTSATLAGQSATVTFLDENTIKITTPNATAGAATITLTNPDGVSYTASGLVTIQ